ncbi:MAG: Asp-tRNA(Asn)/Glu-tRNA(Gln) amidotransferase subunit GatA [Verrucomicrobia bacterium]|nr:Asp-tRNA(Asn)/Glu-tRNA(Gln) amidotransferase subunit GatA [Verrucomicrobiota bacterium]
MELHHQFKSGAISAEEIVKKTLHNIETFDSRVGAFLRTLKNRALEKAALLDKKRKSGKPLGKLAGIPIAVKDNIHVQGELTTCASKILHNYRAVFDSTATRLIEAEDGILIGKTNMDEFAMGSSTENSAFQSTKNPWNLKCTPGGSSGGSAAAVAARFCPLALGSDTGGSIRQPAAFTGVVGFKPTYGRVSRYGLVAFGSSFDQIGPFATTVSDAALLMEVMGHPCSFDATSLPIPPEAYLEKLQKPIRGARIGIPHSFLKDLNSEAKSHFDTALAVYKELGCTFVDIDLDILRYGIAIYYILATAEASTNLARFDGVRFGHRSKEATTMDQVFDLSRKEGFGPEVKRRIMLGTYVLSSGYQDAYYKHAQKVRTLIIQQFKKAFAECDVIATPTSPFPAFEIGAIQDPLQMYLADIYTVSANLAGVPAISIPCGFSSDQKPIGLHLTGPQLHDADVLRFAHHFEQATDFAKRRPHDWF